MLSTLVLSVLLMAPDCPKKPVTGMPGVFFEESFAYDRGCGATGYTVDGKLYKDVNSALPALEKGGWADKKKRVALTIAWAQRLFDDRLEGPTAKLQPDGSVVLDGKYKPRPSMRGPTPEDLRETTKMKVTANGMVTFLRDE